MMQPDDLPDDIPDIPLRPWPDDEPDDEDSIYLEDD
jgi:hypothetical protein